jgi:hypothetical protein
MKGALLMFLILSGCSGPPRLLVYELPQSGLSVSDYKEFQKQIESAPIVIVGTIISDVLADRWTRINPVPPELGKLGVQVENVLRGDIKSKSISIYFFITTGGYDGPRPLGLWSLGDRHVFYVRPDSGVLRLACDIVDHCTIIVRSGAHPSYKSDPTIPVNEAVTDILLTRGEGVTDEQFITALKYGGPAPVDYIVDKLNRIASSEDIRLRTAACKQLSYYGKPCH